MFTTAERRAVGEAARAYDLPEAHVLAIVQVESNGVIFAEVEGRKEPLIRFEGHIFHRLLAGKERDAAVAQGLASSKAGGVKNPKGQAGRWALLARAMRIDRQAALESCSYGVGQVMGFHWQALGFSNVDEMVDTARRDLAGQVDLMLRYVRIFGLEDELREGQWAPFARGYNGPGYRANHYDTKMADAAALFGGKISPAGGMLRMGAKGARVRELQALLQRAGQTVEVDGDFGPATKAAVLAFQRASGLKADGIFGPVTEKALAALRQDPADKPGEQPVEAIAEVRTGIAAAAGGALTIEVARRTLEEAAKQVAASGIDLPIIEHLASGLTAASSLVAVAGIAWAAYGWFRAQRTVEA